MKANKKIFLCILMLLSISLYSITVAAESSERFGVILIAHGSTKAGHNEAVGNLKNRIMAEPAPNQSLTGLEIAFLGDKNTGATPNVLKQFKGKNTDSMAQVLKQFSNKNAKNILLIPISPCSYIRHEEIKTLAEKAGNGAFQFKLAAAMDDNSLAAEIIKEHATRLSKERGNTSLLLVSYGPVEELENITWIRRLERMGKTVCSEMGFKEVACATIRNHSPDLIAEQSIIDLRVKAKALKEKGRVIVVPYIFQNGPYEDLELYLNGIVPPDDISKEGFISHPNVDTWIKEVIKKGMDDQPQVKPVNKNWSTKGGDRSHF
jgi:hypothetical protein